MPAADFAKMLPKQILKKDQKNEQNMNPTSNLKELNLWG